MDALKEISMQEPETPWMFDEYRYILDNAERITKVGRGGQISCNKDSRALKNEVPNPENSVSR